MNDTTPTKTTMRELLTRWAEVEPGRCEPSKSPRLANIFTVQAGEEAKNIYDPDNLSGLDLAWIQWAVQQAIVARGWRFDIQYPRHSFPPYYTVVWVSDQSVNFDETEREGPAIAETLLESYLKLLERHKYQTEVVAKRK